MHDLQQILTKISTTQTFKWKKEALCKELDPSMFFPDFRGVNIAKYIDEALPCKNCPVQQECIDFADESGEEWGIWGGEYRTPRLMAQRAANGK